MNPSTHQRADPYPGTTEDHGPFGLEAVIDQTLDPRRVEASFEEIMSATICPRCEKLGGVGGSSYRRVWRCVSCGAFGLLVPRKREKVEGP
jgi:ribosomal protein L37AE/L43A